MPSHSSPYRLLETFVRHSSTPEHPRPSSACSHRTPSPNNTHSQQHPLTPQYRQPLNISTTTSLTPKCRPPAPHRQPPSTNTIDSPTSKSRQSAPKHRQTDAQTASNSHPTSTSLACMQLVAAPTHPTKNHYIRQRLHQQRHTLPAITTKVCSSSLLQLQKCIPSLAGCHRHIINAAPNITPSHPLSPDSTSQALTSHIFHHTGPHKVQLGTHYDTNHPRREPAHTQPTTSPDNRPVHTEPRPTLADRTPKLEDIHRLKPPPNPHQRLYFYLISTQVLKAGSMAQQPTYQPQQALMEQYNKFRHQVLIKSPTSYKSQPPHKLGGEEDLDMDAQLENVSLERGGSSLQVSLGEDSIQVAQATPWKSVPVGEGTSPTLSYRNPRLEDASESQTTKRRKAADYSVTSTPTIQSKSIPPSSHMRPKRLTTLGIDMIGQMWLGFHMH